MDETLKRVYEIDVRGAQDAIRYIENIAKSAESTERRVGGLLGSIKGLVVGVTTGLAAYFTASNIFFYLNNLTKELDAIGDAADRLGTTSGIVGFLHQLGQLGEMKSLPEMEMVVRKFGIAVADSNKSTSQAAQVFKALGVEIKSGDLIGNLKRYAEQFDKIGDAELKAKANQLILGRGGKDAASLLKSLADVQGDVNDKVKEYEDRNKKSIEEAGKLDTSIKKISKTMQDFGVLVLNEVLPPINAFFDRFSKPEFDPTVTALRAVAKAIAEVWGWIHKTNEEAKATPYGRLMEGARKGMGLLTEEEMLASGRLKKGIIQRPQERTQEEEDVAQAALAEAKKKETKNPIDEALRNIFGDREPKAGKAKAIKEQLEKISDWSPLELRWTSEWEDQFVKPLQKAQEMVDRLTGVDGLKDLQEQITALKGAVDSGKITWDQYDAALDKVLNIPTDGLSDLKEYVAQLEKLKGLPTDKVTEAVRSKLNIDSFTGMDKVKQMSDELGKLQWAEEHAIISSDELDKAYQKIFAETVPDASEKAIDALQGVSTAITDAAGDIADALFDADKDIGEKLSSIVKNFAKTIIRLQFEAAIRPVAKGFSDWVTGLLGVPGSLGTSAGVTASGVSYDTATAGLGLTALGAVFSSSGRLRYLSRGGVFSSPAMFRDMAGGWNVLGEAGEEAVMPLRRGRDGKLGVAGASPEVNVSMPVTVENYGSNTKISAREKKGPDGKRQLVIAVHDIVRGGMASGEYDSTMGSAFGLTRQGRR